MKIYILANTSPCFDCSTIEVISIHDSCTDALVARDEYIAHPWTVNEKDIDVLEMELGSQLRDARFLEAWDETEP